MKSSAPSVTREIQIAPMSRKPPSSEVPASYTEAAVLYESLGEAWIDNVSRTAIVNRKSGFQFPTMLLFLFAYFTSGASSMKKLCTSLQYPANRRLAEFAGLKKFPSQSSVSRLLKRVWHEQLDELVTWILVTSHSATHALLKAPICASLDTLGGAWQLFDLDPSVTGLRQRRLPDDSSLPPAVRDSANFAAPGYAGRKRADVIVRRTLVQHVSSSLWVHSSIRQGGGGARETFQAGIDSVLECCDFAGFDPARCILRIDGEGSGVPYITAYQEAGLNYLVRCTHYSLLDEVNLNQLLAEGRWFAVEMDGVPRHAIDLGECVLAPGASTMRIDNTPYEPVVSRVVLTRTCADRQSDSTSGKVVDGFRYELFATGLEPAEWPAAEISNLYCQRSAIENRLATEDRDLGLDKVFSFDLAGQALVTVVGLLVWNLRVLLGFELAGPELKAEGVPPQRVRKARPVSFSADELAPPYDAADCEQALDVDEPQDVDSRDTGSEDDESRYGGARDDETSVEQRQDELARAIHDEIDRNIVPEKLPTTMSWSEDGLMCSNEIRLPLSGKRTLCGQHYAILKAPPRCCGDCPERSECSRSTKPAFRKEVLVVVPSAERIAGLLAERKSLELTARRVNSRETPQRTTQRQPQTVPSRPVYEPPDGGPLSIATSMLNPRELVHRFAEAIAQTALHVRVRPQPVAPARRRYTYRDARARRRRRHTWTERLSYNRRPAGPRVTAFCGPRAENVMTLRTSDRERAALALQRAKDG